MKDADLGYYQTEGVLIVMLGIETDVDILDIVRAEKKAIEAADRRIQDWQKRIKKGDFFKRITSDGLEIFGEVLEDYEGNFRTCRCYSIVCPEGERGSIHVSQIDQLVDRQTFEMVKNKLGTAWRLALKRLKAEGYL